MWRSLWIWIYWIIISVICVSLHCVEVCTHCYIVQAGTCRKCELHNWGDVPGDNLWSDPATGDSGSLGGLLQRAKLWVLQVVWMDYMLVGLPFLMGGNNHLYLLLYPRRVYRDLPVCMYVCSFVLKRHHRSTDFISNRLSQDFTHMFTNIISCTSSKMGITSHM